MNNQRNSDTILKPTRISALTDGVFAIVMTLLVIELSVPIVSKLKAADKLGGMLLEMWPKFFAFAISFLVLGIFWFIHQNQFRHIKRSNGIFSWINIFFLMIVALIPFSTALIGEYHIYSKVAVIFYGTNGFLGMLILNIVWWYATKNYRLIDKKTVPKTIKQLRIRFIVSTAIFIPAIALSLVNPLIGIALYVLNALFGIIGTMILGGKDPTLSAEKVRSRV
jgi:uncharacterized membrane protein